MDAVRIMVAPQPNGLGMSARGITISTVGLVPAINKLADEDIPSPSRCPCTLPTTSSATSSSRELEVEGGRGDRRRPQLLRQDRAACVDRVRAHQGHERPRVACRPARREAEQARQGVGARQPDPAQPDARSVWTSSEVHVQDEFVRRLNAAGIRRPSATPAARSRRGVRPIGRGGVGPTSSVRSGSSGSFGRHGAGSHRASRRSRRRIRVFPGLAGPTRPGCGPGWCCRSPLRKVITRCR